MPYRFLCEVALYEQAGVVMRMPDWWSAKRRPRPKVSVSVGGKAPSTLGDYKHYLTRRACLSHILPSPSRVSV